MSVPAWLQGWQAEFTDMLCMPLAADSGTLRARHEHYPEALVARTLAGPRSDPARRLAVYNRQYWFRLLSVLHHELLLTARLFGLWHFNHYAQRFLLDHPPRHRELRRIADDFEAFLARSIGGESLQLEAARPALPRAALLQAVQLDLAFARVFCAPEVPRLVLPDDPAQLLSVRLTPSAGYARFTERWPLVKLRHGCVGESTEAALPLPAAHTQPRHWALFRNEHGVVNVPLTAAQARLYELLEQLPLAAALAQLERDSPPDLHEALPELTRRWLEQAVEHGFFCAAH